MNNLQDFQPLENIMNLNSPKELDVKMVDQELTYLPMMYEDLPPVFQTEIDDLATDLLDPDRGHIVVIGAPQSGKSFLINQLVGNFDRYLNSLGRDAMHFIRLKDDDMNAIMSLPKQYDTYIRSLMEEFDCLETDICFVTDNHMIAAKIFGWTNKARIIHETSRGAFLNLIHGDAVGNKIWAAWLFTDVTELVLTKKEVIALTHEALNERLKETYNVDLTKKIIAMFISHTLRKMPLTVSSDDDKKGKLLIPVGIWLTAFRKVAGTISLGNSPALQDRNGNIALGKVIAKVFKNHQEVFSMFEEEGEDDFEEGQPIMFQGADGQMVRVFIPQAANAQSGEGVSEEAEAQLKEKPVFNSIEKLSKSLESEVLGQDDALKSIVNGMIVPAAGLNDPTKPIRSMIFLGPTGVGKTKMATTLAENLLAEPLNLVRVDMSEYSQAHEAAKLLGAPPGYTGFEQGGVLTNAIKKHPRSLILLDEIEKAHPQIWDSFLQILDAGRMTDGRGEVVDFTQTVVVMTSNIGAKETQHTSVGFGNLSASEAYKMRQKDSKKILQAALEETFRPELLNRIDEVVEFNEISPETAMLIINKELGILSDRMEASGYSLGVVSSDILNEVLAYSNITKYGAREIQRVILDKISSPIAKRMIDAGGDEDVVKTFSLEMNEDNTISANLVK